MSFSNSSYSNKSMTGIYVSETVRLQNETDKFTQKLEHEKRQLMIVEDQIKQALAEIEEKKEKVKSIRPSNEELRKRNAGILNIQKSIRNEELRLNETNAQNQILKKNIDTHRKELKSTSKMIKKYNKNIGKARKDAKKKNEAFVDKKKKAEETNDQILALKAKHEEEKNRFEVEIRKLQHRLNEKDNTEELKEKSVSAGAGADEKKAATGDPKAQFSNPITILKMRLNKFISTNKEKKKLVDQYIRNVKIIEDAFDQIKESTGISSIDEIVTTFIKAEEQNYSLFNYVNRLGQETDQLQEANNQAKQLIAAHKDNEAVEEVNREKRKQELQNEIGRLKEKIDKSNEDKDYFKSNLKTIQNNVEKVVKLFNKCKFSLAVANPMSYEEGTNFNETNVIQYLAELEEYISMLITYAAFRKEEPFAAISAIPIDKIPKKEFEKGKYNVNEPLYTQVEGAQDGAAAEDDSIVNPLELHKKFNFLVQNHKISFVTKTTAKQSMNLNVNRNNDS